MSCEKKWPKKQLEWDLNVSHITSLFSSPSEVFHFSDNKLSVNNGLKGLLWSGLFLLYRWPHPLLLTPCLLILHQLLGCSRMLQVGSHFRASVLALSLQAHSYLRTLLSAAPCAWDALLSETQLLGAALSPSLPTCSHVTFSRPQQLLY